MPLKTKRSTRDDPGLLASDRTLRIISIINFVPAFALLIPYGIISEEICPALDLVPMFISASFGLVHACKTIKSRTLETVIDGFIATFLIAILIPGWVTIAENARHWNGETALIGAYGTMPVMTNFCIHVHFATRKYVESKTGELCRRLRYIACPQCPHCQSQDQPVTNWRKATREGSIRSQGSRERYLDDPETVTGRSQSRPETYRDDPEGNMSDDESTGSVSISLPTGKGKAAPLFKAPPPDEDEDPAVLV